MNKIIFLDIDGVLNSINWYMTRGDNRHDREGDEFDPLAVKRLNEITMSTNSDIVISSCWRLLHTHDDLKRIFNIVGIKGNIIGKTAYLMHDEFRIPRGIEIQHWLKLTKWENQYVIIDDSSDMLYEQKDNFVHTDVQTGLTELDVIRAKDILNRGII